MRTSPLLRNTALMATAVALAAAVTSSPALAGDAGDRAAAPTTIAKGLFSPLSAAIGPGGSAYVAQSFAGQIVRVERHQKPRTVFSVKHEGDEAGGVSFRKGTLTFAITGAGGGAVVKQLDTSSGKVRTLADVKKYEATHNPDGDITYGIEGISDECAAAFPEDGFPAVYPGIVESHPYATATTPDGKRTYVADAAGNAILGITKAGTVSTVAVLPAVPVVLTEEIAAGLGFPECSVGETYDFEPVPTDVEVGPGGQLYVSTLPGGPEDGSAGPLAAAYRVDPKTGSVSLVADGLVSAVGVAVDPSGAVYVSQLFAGSIVKVAGGATTTFASTAIPGAVEVKDGSVYATVNVLSGMSGEPGDVPNGKLVRFAG